jgi:SNF2 family DNA or RNA helicase
VSIQLYPFQQEDVQHLQGQKSVAILNEMGTGKTIEAVARDFQIAQEADGQTLIVAPLGALDAWREVLLDLQFPELHRDDVISITDGRDEFLKSLIKGDHTTYLMNWENLRLPTKSVKRTLWAGDVLYPVLTKTKFLHVIADEAHKAKNRKAQQTIALKRIKTVWKTALTGTPITNKPDDLWSILHWLYPKIWTSYWKFVNYYTIVHEETNWATRKSYRIIEGVKNGAELQKVIAPYTVKHKKSEVAPQLPDKYYSTITVELDPKQRRAYDSMLKNMVAWIGENEEQTLVASAIVSRLQRLQQFAISHAEIQERLNRDGEIEQHVILREPSAKLDAVMDLIESNPEQKFVVFTQFRGAVELLMARLEAAGVQASTIIGGQSAEVRKNEIENFISKRQVIVGTIAAGGVALDGLQVASTVVFVDRTWSPPLNSQAEDRLHRFGQKSAVQVIDIIAKNTVDRGRAQKLVIKRGWARDLLGI